MLEKAVLFPRTPKLEPYMKEVREAKTFNARTGKPYLGGLFGEDIFGPTTDYVCHCKALSGLKNAGQVCDKCGVELMPASERSNRFGYITFFLPAFHPISFGMFKYLLPQVDKADWQAFVDAPFHYIVELQAAATSLLRNDEDVPVAINLRPVDDTISAYNYGIIGLVNALHELSLPLTNAALNVPGTKVAAPFKKLVKKMVKHEATFVDTFFLRHLLVLPPNHRPLIQVGNSYKVDAINEVYALLINRNNRLGTLMTFAPTATMMDRRGQPQPVAHVIMSEWQMLNKLVGAYFFGNRLTLNGEAIIGRVSRIGGKEGSLRGTLLGKRLDYSGRTVIACGPDLTFGHIGVPEAMAYELLRLHILRDLVKQGLSESRANDWWKNRHPRAWAAMMRLNGKVRVMANRQPSLHRYSVMSFLMDIVPGKVIRLHPACTNPFNADFDGDQMALYIEHSQEAVYEQEMLMAPQQIIMSATSGDVQIQPQQEFVFGLYLIK